MSGTSGTLGAVEADYRARGAAFGATEERLRRRADRISQLRLAAFVVALGSGLALGGSDWPRSMLVAGLIIGAVTFVAVARWHALVRRAASRARVRRVVCEQGPHRIARDWSAIASQLPDTRVPDHPYAGDLDVTGHASLGRLLDVTSAGPGRRTLTAWLMDQTASVAELRIRQQSVRAIAPDIEWRETLTAHAWTAAVARRGDVERFLTWAEQTPWLIARPTVLWASRILPLLTIPLTGLALAAAMWAVGVDRPTSPTLLSVGAFAKAWWWLPFFAGIVLLGIARHALANGIKSAVSHLSGLTAYAEMLAHVEAAPFTADGMESIKRRVATGRGAAGELTRLGTIVRFAEARYSPMAHAFLQFLGLWDFHVLAALERWQRASGSHARDWLAALGEAEALSALATVAYDNPDWVMPEFVDGPARVEAVSLGHPLLAARSRVSNDVSIGPPGTFMLVTGSNMSGKSTLLRALGTNIVLAQAGGPVCAASMRFTPVDIWTSIRIDDSLEAGVSLFMAELRRLKRIVDAARDPNRSRPLLYLLDEMLHGTNTAERRIAARRVLSYLLDAGAIGAVTTHDLTLAEDSSLDTAAHRVHFTEQFDQTPAGMSMTFDYRLRPGLATSANALKLLAMIGLDDAAPPVRRTLSQ